MVLGFLGNFIGLGIGVTLGILAGTKFLVKYFAQPDLKHLDIRADYDDSVAVPDTHGKPVPAKYRDFVTYFPNWVTMPDFYRVTWMNHILTTLWPHYNQAIGKMVLESAKPQIEDITRQYPFVEAIDIELIDFGTKPLHVGGLKVFNSHDDEVIMECPLFWGSNARVRASARVRLWRWSLYIPMEVNNIQLKVTSRLTLKPLVDTLPCMGAINLTLIEDPYVDFGFHLFKPFDWMLLPGVSHLARYAIKSVVGDLLGYPNTMSIDIMEGGGVPPPPVGLLQVKILKVDKITGGGDLLSKVDPYIEVGVRERTQRTRTIWNTKNPDYQEVFNLIVDDPELQTLSFKLHDDDMGFNDPVIGVCELDLAGSRFIQKPKHRAQMELDFISPPAMKKMKRLVEKSNKRAAKEQQKPPDVKDTGKVDEQGRKQYKIPEGPVGDEAKQEAEEKKSKNMVGKMHFEVIYVPFEGVRTHSASKKTDNDDEDYEDHNSNAASKARNAVRNLNQISDEDKGILTVTLTGCMNLQAADGGVDPYVVLKLMDPKTIKPEVQKSSSMTNEPNPHWNTKFDFALCSATSVLQFNVFDKKSTMQNVVHTVLHPVESVGNKITGKKEGRDEMIGSLRIKVKDVVRNERIRDSWALQETQKGDIQLTLDWIPISLASIDETLEEPGDQFEVERLRKKQEEEEERRKNGDVSAGRRKSLTERLHRRKSTDARAGTSPHQEASVSEADSPQAVQSVFSGPVKNSEDHEKKSLFQKLKPGH